MKWLQLPEQCRGTDLDSPETTRLHAEIIQRKRFLRELYREYYTVFLHTIPHFERSIVVEIGSGGGFIKKIIPNAITSDVIPLPELDRCFNATQMPFEANSVDCFCMINTLHHIPDVGAMFREFERCLKPEGKVITIEPANTPFSRWIYTHFHHESFDPTAGWLLPEGGPLSTSNQALPWIVFHRDRKRFKREFPNLEIESIQLHTPLRYLLSGGFTLRQLLPESLYPATRFLDTILLRPLYPWLALFMTIVLSKRDSTSISYKRGRSPHA
jgi:SAM-dependent methyltransferase